MKSTMIVSWGCAVFLAAIGCDAPPAPATSGNGSGTGAVQLALRATAGGATYVLANARFSVVRVQPPPDPGAVNVLILHQSDPTAGNLRAENLPVGQYEITLVDGWELDREDSPTNLVPVHATLQSANPVTVSVFSGQTTTVTFQLQTNGIPLTFGPGSIDIGVDVGTCDAAPPPGVELNIITNPDFEKGTEGWMYQYGPLTLSAGHCGTHGGSSTMNALYVLPRPQIATTYAISAWMKQSSPSDAISGFVEIDVSGGSPCPPLTIYPIASAPLPRDSWVRFAGVATVGGTGCGLGLLTFYVSGAKPPNGDPTISIDDVYVIPQ